MNHRQTGERQTQFTTWGAETLADICKNKLVPNKHQFINKRNNNSRRITHTSCFVATLYVLNGFLEYTKMKQV